MPALETALRAARDRGRKAFLPYVTGGYAGVDAALLRGLADAGADAIEVGIPHSDPIIDGGVVQQASADALAAGVTVEDVFATIHEAGVGVPVVVMTYVNPVLRRGEDAFLGAAAAAGAGAVIVPDLPADEAGTFVGLARAHAIDPVLLAAPGTTPARLRAVAEAAGGFVYCVATYGVTGARETLAGTAAELVAALRPLTDLPLLVGVGIGTPAAATEACGFADGVIVGSALMRALIDDGPAAAVALASAFRAATS